MTPAMMNHSKQGQATHIYHGIDQSIAHCQLPAKPRYVVLNRNDQEGKVTSLAISVDCKLSSAVTRTQPDIR